MILLSTWLLMLLNYNLTIIKNSIHIEQFNAKNKGLSHVHILVCQKKFGTLVQVLIVWKCINEHQELW